jgi:hypothetical protein
MKNYNGFYALFDQMVWPCPGFEMDQLSQKLRYPGHFSELTRSEMAMAAEIIGSYRNLVCSKRKFRESVVKQIKIAAANSEKQCAEATNLIPNQPFKPDCGAVGSIQELANQHVLPDPSTKIGA